MLRKSVSEVSPGLARAGLGASRPSTGLKMGSVCEAPVKHSLWVLLPRRGPFIGFSQGPCQALPGRARAGQCRIHTTARASQGRAREGQCCVLTTARARPGQPRTTKVSSQGFAYCLLRAARASRASLGGYGRGKGAATSVSLMPCCSWCLAESYAESYAES